MGLMELHCVHVWKHHNETPCITNLCNKNGKKDIAHGCKERKRKGLDDSTDALTYSSSVYLMRLLTISADI
jgi:hypothetical protein